jgi:hypothetical protein
MDVGSHERKVGYGGDNVPSHISAAVVEHPGVLIPFTPNPLAPQTRPIAWNPVL